MAVQHTIKTTIKVRNDTAENWLNSNPILAQGEFGLENDTFLLKIGNNETPWNELQYLNKFNPDSFIMSSDGTISINNNIFQSLESIITEEGGVISGQLQLTRIPTSDDDVTNKNYVDTAINNAIANAEIGYLKYEIVKQIPLAAEAQENVIYMILDSSIVGADKYKEYMLINNTMTQIGDTSINLSGLVSGNFTPGNLIITDNNGNLIDSGIAANNFNQLSIATTNILGGVKSGTGEEGDDRVVVDNETGFMTLAHVSTNLLYVPNGDTLILDGGKSNGGITNG